MKIKITQTYYKLNFFCFILGMIGVWLTTYSGWALFWCAVASVHFQKKLYEGNLN
jgi:hypothetical protein